MRAWCTGIQEGVVSTGNSLDYTPQCMDIMNEHGVAVKEMEAAAVAEVCRDHRVPFVALKAVTDIVDGGRATEVRCDAHAWHACASWTGLWPLGLAVGSAPRGGWWRRCVASGGVCSL